VSGADATLVSVYEHESEQNSTGDEKMMTGKKITNGLTVAVVVLGIVGMTVGSANAGQIYFDDFSGGAGTDLNGTTPDVTTGGETWVATSEYKADGTYTGIDTGPMTLAFTPVDGREYTLDMSVAMPVGGVWTCFGFANGQPLSTPNNVAWLRAWHLSRPDGQVGAKHNTSLNGYASLTAYPATGGIDVQPSPLDLRVVLDTTGGTGNWTVTMYAKAAASPTYIEVRAATTLAAADITSVGYFGRQTSGTITSFSLSDDSAGPSATPGTLIYGK
jgi:hypothetical protein